MIKAIQRTGKKDSYNQSTQDLQALKMLAARPGGIPVPASFRHEPRARPCSDCPNELSAAYSLDACFLFYLPFDVSACTVAAGPVAVYFSASLREPAHINCSPARIAIMATTVLSLAAGMRRASTQPSTTPGTPPARS